MEAILFLIGVQELGKVKESFSKEEKQDLMHIAVCTVLEPGGYYQREALDAGGWPHFKQVKPMPAMSPVEQENFLKDHILLYFHENEFLANE